MSSLTFGAKQPYEAYFIDFDFVNEIDDSDHIESALVTASDGVADVTDDIIDETRQIVAGTKVSIWIMDGASGATYKITCQIVTAVLEEKYEAEASMTVLET